jgi:hypothetical protein
VNLLLGELLDDLLVLVELLEVVHRELVQAQLLRLASPRKKREE